MSQNTIELAEEIAPGQFRFLEMGDLPILTKTRHKVTISFDIDVAPELADKIRNSIGKDIFFILGYPINALDVDYSFNNPKPPDQVAVTVEKG